jgi:hypothetical protein
MVLASTALGVASDLTAKEQVAARKLYVSKCAKCHRFYDPAAYPEPEWRRWMESMARKSKLKREQAALLDRYLEAYRANAEPGKRLPEAPLPKPAK